MNSLHFALEQPMQPLQIERQTNQIPLARRRLLAAQRELPKSQYLFDDPDHRLDRAFAQAVDCLPECGFEFVGHLDLGAGILGRRRAQLSKALPPPRMVPIPSGGDIWVDTPALEKSNICLGKVPRFQRTPLLSARA